MESFDKCHIGSIEACTSYKILEVAFYPSHSVGW